VRDDPRLDRLDALARLLDARWRIPLTPWRIGLDGIAGLVPGLGDAAGGVVSAYLVWEARRMGAPTSLLARMAVNVALDVTVGAVPVAGSIFDIAFKANLRNVRLLQAYLASRRAGDDDTDWHHPT
jgi:hypothetical protein